MRLYRVELAFRRRLYSKTVLARNPENAVRIAVKNVMATTKPSPFDVAVIRNVIDDCGNEFPQFRLKAIDVPNPNRNNKFRL
jgi:hypothetical protein